MQIPANPKNRDRQPKTAEHAEGMRLQITGLLGGYGLIIDDRGFFKANRP